MLLILYQHFPTSQLPLVPSKYQRHQSCIEINNEEFLTGEEHCHYFINQDLTFLQPLTVYDTKHWKIVYPWNQIQLKYL